MLIKKKNDSRMCIFYEKGFNYLFITENEMRNGFFFTLMERVGGK